MPEPINIKFAPLVSDAAREYTAAEALVKLHFGFNADAGGLYENASSTGKSDMETFPDELSIDSSE